jgi:nucleotide-binding universal stress UspA family protein
MTILCGVDFSEPARRAARVAAGFARSLGEPLVLAHVVDVRALLTPTDELLEAARLRLAELAAELGGAGLRVEARVASGAPDEGLVELATSLGAGLVVVARLGQRSGSLWRVGSVASRVMQSASVPVLAIEEATSFESFFRGERPLRVLAGAEFSESADASSRWIATLRSLGPCDVTFVHVYDPVRQWARLGLRPPVVVGHENAEIDSLLRRELRARLGEVPGPGRTELRVEMSLDPVPETLAWIADQEQYDLLVVGSRRRSGLARLRHDPVSQGLLRAARTAVACVPTPPLPPRAIRLPKLARVLAPTDFSEVGNHALRYAYALLPRGGTVHLLHAVEEDPLPNPLYAHYTPGRRPTPEERAAQEKDLEVAMRGLVPDEAESRGIDTRVEIVHGSDPAEAIHAAGERLGADAICMGTHGRTGLSSLVAGSVARKVAAVTSRPLFLIRPPSDD